MAIKSLAIKYRPKTFNDVSEQSAVITILNNQLATGTTKNGYLFCGGAGTGKTTCARIFANEINKGSGNPIELDAASNNSVEDIRKLTEQAQTKSLDSEYKVFIIDECHSLSNQAWQAMLKTLEEPPAKSIFIFCTTNPEKIPQTILSRVQRYNFQRISQDGVYKRLNYIASLEKVDTVSQEALEYIAKIADGGMRDAITLMDKCLSYSNNLTMDNVVNALGVADYSTLVNLTDVVNCKSKLDVAEIVNEVYASGKDLKLFVKEYFEFILDLNIWGISHDESLVKIPNTCLNEIQNNSNAWWETVSELLKFTTDLQSEIKWEQNPKAVIVSRFMLFMGGK